MTLDTRQAPTFEELARRVDDAIATVGTLEPAVREKALALRSAIEAFHRQALVAMVRTLRSDPRGKELLFELVEDPSIAAVLALHGIIRPGTLARANAALEAVRPYLQSHGGDVELVAVDNGVARVRLHGACSGCSMSAATLREGVERALVDGVEEISGIEVLQDEPTAAFVPLGSVGRRDLGWVAGPAAEAVPLGGMARVECDGASFIVTNIDNRLAAFRNECAHQGLSLDGGRISDGVLECPWHGFRYDAATGECLTAPGVQLAQAPLRIDGGRIFIRAR